ncbi:hypothetical protein P4O66_005153 [Electrophorus voltai]|uniref:Uncharacterized protein n=1 Tax=Electrophorus voltai TaxID=2609070 RepID=A0AAD8ZWV0_9TELE|nr:hypothetical protein P4O66_005153 [Electrophorus voltai]
MRKDGRTHARVVQEDGGEDMIMPALHRYLPLSPLYTTDIVKEKGPPSDPEGHVGSPSVEYYPVTLAALFQNQNVL